MDDSNSPRKYGNDSLSQSRSHKFFSGKPQYSSQFEQPDQHSQSQIPSRTNANATATDMKSLYIGGTQKIAASMRKPKDVLSQFILKHSGGSITGGVLTPKNELCSPQDGKSPTTSMKLKYTAHSPIVHSTSHMMYTIQNAPRFVSKKPK